MDMGMDHNHDHNHGDDTGPASCPMIMTFHSGHCEKILWNGWVASTVTEFVFSAIAIFAVAFFYEFLKFVREYLLRKTVRKEAERMAMQIKARNGPSCPISTEGGDCPNMPLSEIQQKSYLERISGSTHLVQTLINFIQVVISYLLMLVFMTFNYWLCLAVVLGLGVGYFFFGWIKQDVYETECCH